MPAVAGEIFFEITSQDLPKMALLSSFFIEKSILEDYARRPWQFFSCLTAICTPKLPVFGAAFHQNIHDTQKYYAGGSRRKFFLMSIEISIFDVFTNKKSQVSAQIFGKGGSLIFEGGGQNFF